MIVLKDTIVEIKNDKFFLDESGPIFVYAIFLQRIDSINNILTIINNMFKAVLNKPKKSPKIKKKTLPISQFYSLCNTKSARLFVLHNCSDKNLIVKSNNFDITCQSKK